MTINNNCKTNIPSFIMLIGLPGSGKSYYARQLSMKYKNCHICSSDEMRIKILGDVNDQNSNNIIFTELHKIIKKHLENGDNVIYDATNVYLKNRKSFLKEIEHIDCIKEAHILCTPFYVCINRNLKRERVVPYESINRIYHYWQTPMLYEGFDDIKIIRSEYNHYTIPEPYELRSFNQYNEHHRLSLGDHMICAGDFLKYNKKIDDEILITAAYYHDIGKIASRKFDKNNQAHYYGHENVGAYNVLCCDNFRFSNDDTVRLSFLINNHMIFLSGNPNALERRRQLWGDELYAQMVLLNEADINAH